jgi:hypothetical protein
MALAKSTFDSRMPQTEGGRGSVVLVWMCMVLELGLTEGHIFVWIGIRAGGGVSRVHRLDVCCGH